MADLSDCRDHPTDADLLERLLAREADPHLPGCGRCAARAEAIAREIDPLRDESTPEPFDEAFYRRQAARIRARIAAGEGRRAPLLSLLRPGVSRLRWAGAMAAALATIAIALYRLPAADRGGRPANEPITLAALNDFPTAKDLADDRLLREIDATLDEDL